METIKPSLFNRRITVKRAIVLADDAGGAANDGFTTRFSCWAFVGHMSDARKAYYGLDLFTEYWEVKLYYREFSTSDIVDYGTTSLSVQGIQNVYEGYKRFTILTCVQSTTS